MQAVANIPPRSRRLPLALAGLLLASAVALPTRADDAQSPPTNATPMSQPAAALEMTQVEQDALGDVIDRDTQLDQPAFYLLLSKAAGLAAADETAPLDRPAPESLLKYPNRWRGWPMTLTLRVYGVRKLLGADELSDSPHWASDRPVWQLSGLAGYGGQAVMVFSPLPPEGLGQPARSGDHGEDVYPTGPQIEIDGFFYKLWRHPSIEGTPAEFPVVVAWRSEPPLQPRDGSILGENRLMPVLLLGGLAVLWVLIRRRTRRRGGKPATQGPTYRFRSGWTEAPPKAPDEPVDPRLTDAVEQYRKDRRREEGDDAPHSQG